MWDRRPAQATKERIVRLLRASGSGTDDRFLSSVQHAALPDLWLALMRTGASGNSPVSFDGRGFGIELAGPPLAILSARGRLVRVAGPAGSTAFSARPFDALDAALEAWRDIEGAVLAGFLGYELAADLEDLPKLSEAHKAHDYRESVARTVARIHRGDLFQTNLCRRWESPFDARLAPELYSRMREQSDAEFAALLRIAPDQCVMSISPELFLSVEDGVVESRPIKGTRPRGADAEADARLAAELLASEKDRAELAMIVDVTRNDLGRVAAPGSVCVARHAELVTLPTVHHTVSTVRAKLREGRGLVDLLRAAFPAASISGAPKIQAIKVAMEEEGVRRGPAMGAIGWIGFDGRMRLSVAIRTAVATGGRVYFHAGAGITAGSDPDAEFAETEDKARAFVRALAATIKA